MRFFNFDEVSCWYQALSPLGDENEVLAQGFNARFKREDARRLAPEVWLNDEVRAAKSDMPTGRVKGRATFEQRIVTINYDAVPSQCSSSSCHGASGFLISDLR